MSTETDNIVSLIAKDMDDLFRTLDQSNGELILDLSLEREDESPFLRVFNSTPQLIIAHPLDELEEEEYELESEEISQNRFENIVSNSELILIKPRSDTPFSKEVQQQLWNKEQTD